MFETNSRHAARQPPAHAPEAAVPVKFTVSAADGYPVSGYCWTRSECSEGSRSVVIINPATSVRCQYYFRFADYLFRNGFDVIAYDYRGIGASRPADLGSFDASWIDWGWLDFAAVLGYARTTFPESDIDVVAHSVGGVVLGIAPGNGMVRRAVTVGAQYAYWRDYAPQARLAMLAKWHLAMPLLTAAFGYFPGSRLGWLEDTPAGIVRDWVFSARRFEEGWRGGAARRLPGKDSIVRQFRELTAATLAISVSDDEFGTVPAVERLLAYCSNSSRTHLRISPESIGASAIGHFGFFHSRHSEPLWQLPLAWLRKGELPERHPGVVQSQNPSPSAYGQEKPA